MTTAISSGLQGYDRAEAMVNNAAAQIANYSAAQLSIRKVNFTTSDAADLSTMAVSLLEGKNSAEANIATIHVADEMQKSLIDMIG